MLTDRLSQLQVVPVVSVQVLFGVTLVPQSDGS
jgi:hypothetical protein